MAAVDFDATNSQAVASVAKAASNQPDVRTMLIRNSVVMSDEAKQRDLNKVIVNHLVVHDMLSLSILNSGQAHSATPSRALLNVIPALPPGLA